MQCPKCGREMELGWLHGGNPLYWSRKKHKLTNFMGANDVCIQERFTMEEPQAWLCRDCQLVIAPYGQQEENNS